MNGNTAVSIHLYGSHRIVDNTWLVVSMIPIEVNREQWTCSAGRSGDPVSGDTIIVLGGNTPVSDYRVRVQACM